MHRFCAAANCRLLHFDEVPHNRALFHLRIHPKMREWTNRAIIRDLGIDDQAVIFDGESEWRSLTESTGLILASAMRSTWLPSTLWTVRSRAQLTTNKKHPVLYA